MKPYRKYDEETLNKLKEELVCIFEIFDKLCRKHNIKYFATAGTLLGAIRHEEFIPWDDDLDIGMLREEYNKFLEIDPKEFEGYGLCAPELTPGGYYSFVTKFYKKNTKFITQINYADNKDDMGIFIELFPFDYIDDNKLKKQVKKVNKIKACYTTLACEKIIVFDSGIKGIIKKIVKHMLKIYLKLKGVDLKKLTLEYLNSIDQGKISEKLYTFSDVGHIICKSWVHNTYYKKFANTQIAIPENYDMVLKGLYGNNYMELPPEEKRWNQAPVYIEFSDGTNVNFLDRD